MNVDQIQTLDYLIDDARRDADRARETLVREAEHLAAHMTRVAQQARAGGSINDLGEVQGRALDVDLACARVNDCARRLAEAEHVADRLRSQDDATMSNGVSS